MRRETCVETTFGIRDVTPDEFDGLVIPGGSCADRLRTDTDIVRFVREFFLAGRPLAAIGHAGSLLIEAGVVQERQVTSWPSIKTDLTLAGGRWVDREVVEDGNLITSRKAADVPSLCEVLVRKLAYEMPGRPASRLIAETARGTSTTC